MSGNKKYYYLKLKEDFFDTDAMVVMESMPDGYKYSNILLKLYLRSLKHEGKLMFNDRIPYNSTVLAQVTRHSVGDVERAIKLFQEMDLIEVLDNGAIFISDIQNFVGQSSTEADRIRDYRKRIKEEKEQLKLGDTSVVTNVQNELYKSTPELEIDIEIDIEKERESPDSAKAKYGDDSPYMKLARRLFGHIRKRNPKHKEPNWQTWADDFRKIIELDQRDGKEATAILDWCQNDDFWQNNILSPAKFRKQYDKLYLQVQKVKPQKREWDDWDALS